jgi:putative transposase
MAKLLHPLLMVLARATDRELARMVDYLKAENEILRARLPKRIVTTPAERARLVRVSKPLGTFARWLAAEKPKKHAAANPRKPGRPRTRAVGSL